MLLGTVGTDFAVGHNRFTFGVTDLFDGLPVIPTLVGFLALSECFTMVRQRFGGPMAAIFMKFSYRRVMKGMWDAAFGRYAKETYLGTLHWMHHRDYSGRGSRRCELCGVRPGEAFIQAS